MPNSNTETKTTAQAKKADQAQSPTTEKATKAAHEAIDNFAQKAAGAESYVRSKAEHSAEDLAKKKAALEESLSESVAKTKLFAKENPLLTAGIAFAAGMVVCALLRRK